MGALAGAGLGLCPLRVPREVGDRITDVSLNPTDMGPQLGLPSVLQVLRSHVRAEVPAALRP